MAYQRSPMPRVPPHPQCRERVDAVMRDCLERYAYFGDFLQALAVAAYGDIHAFRTALYQQLSGDAHRNSLLVSLPFYLHNQRNPSYAFIDALLRTNVLHLDGEKIEPDQGGEHRVKLFTLAGLIEVTPETIAAHTEEVLAAARKMYEHGHPPSWNTTARKLIEFHMQGGRMSYGKIAKILHAKESEIVNMLHGIRRKENLKSPLYDFLGLNNDQRALLQQLPVEKRHRQASSKPLRSLDDILAQAEAEDKADVYALLHDLLASRELQISASFKRTPGVTHGGAVTSPFHQMQREYFQRNNRGVNLKNIDIVLDYIDRALTAQKEPPLGTKRRQRIRDIAERSLDGPPPHRAASWQNRMKAMRPEDGGIETNPPARYR